MSNAWLFIRKKLKWQATTHKHTYAHGEPIAVLLLCFDRNAEEVLLKANTRRYILTYEKLLHLLVVVVVAVLARLLTAD